MGLHISVLVLSINHWLLLECQLPFISEDWSLIFPRMKTKLDRFRWINKETTMYRKIFRVYFYVEWERENSFRRKRYCNKWTRSRRRVDVVISFSVSLCFHPWLLTIERNVHFMPVLCRILQQVSDYPLRLRQYKTILSVR